MQLEDYFDFVAADDIRVRGHRIGIETILFDYLEAGLSAEEIALRYPTLSLEEIHATITYYWRRQDDIDAYLRATADYEARMIQKQQSNPQSAVKRLYEMLQKRHNTP